jgi:hypothetical protein
MDRPHRKEMPTHSGVLNEADTSEEVMLNTDEQARQGSDPNTSESSPEGVIPEGSMPSGIIGNAGETESPEQLSNKGGVG